MTESSMERWYDERVEPYVDGDLPDNERRLFEARLALDQELASAVDRARRLALELDRLPSLDCPDDLSRRVLQMTGSRSPMPALGWALAGAMALAVAVGAGRFMAWPDQAAPDAAELAQARADVAVALAYLDRAGQVAARKVGETVVTRGVVAPVSSGFEQGAALRADGEAI